MSIFATSVTSVEQMYCSGDRRVSGAPAHVTVSAGYDHRGSDPAISARRIQKLAPTHRRIAFSLFGTVSDVAYQQGLAAPFIVELFAVRFCVGGTPGIACGRLSFEGRATARPGALPHSGLPTLACVERT